VAHRNGVAPDDTTEPSSAEVSVPAAPERFAVSSLWRGAPRLIGLAVLLNSAILVLSIFAWPPNRSPDELVHVDLIAAVARGTAVPWPAPAELHQTIGDKASVVKAAGCRCDTLNAADAPKHWPSWNDVGGDTATVHNNWMVQHPPLYYVFMAAVLKTFPDWRNHPYNVVLGYLKLINLIFVIPLPLFAWAAARRMTGNRIVSATAGVSAVLIPHIQHLGSSINNDNMLLFEASLLTVLLAYVVRGDSSRRTAIFVALVTTAALLTKGTALLFIPWVLIAYLILWRRSGSWSGTGMRRAVVPAAIALVGSGVLGGWWWARNKIAYGVVQVNGDLADQHRIARRPSITTFGDSGQEFVVTFIRNMTNTFWLDTTERPVPLTIAWVSNGLSIVTGAVILIGILRAFRKRLGGASDVELHRSDVLLVLSLPALVSLILLKGAWAAWRTAMVPNGQQGRYLYPAVVGLLILFAVGLRVLAGRRAVLAATVAIGITQLMMAVALISSYWLPRRQPVSLSLLADAWHTMVVWSALNGIALAALIVIVVLLFAAMLWEAAHFTDEPAAAVADPVSARAREHRGLLGVRQGRRQAGQPPLVH